MSLYTQATKQFGKLQEVNAQARERFNTCKKCKFFNKDFSSCGSPYTGDDVTYRKKKYKTCGCFMHIKTKLPFAECPVGKWGAMDGFGEEYYQEVKDAVEAYESQPTKDNLRAMYHVYKMVLGEAGKNFDADNIGCGSCKAQRLKEMKEYVKRIEKC